MRLFVSGFLLTFLFGCGVVEGLVDEGELGELGSALGSPRVQALDGTRFGLNSHAAHDYMFERFAEIGIRWHRVDMEWSQVERNEGVLDWSLTDRVMDTTDRLGLSVMVSVSYTPAWAAGGTDHALPPRDPSRFVAFVREVVRRYRGRIDCIGIWNEPNLREFWKGSKQQFINDLLVPGLRAIREEAPEMATCGPDLSSSGDERNDWLAPILASPAGGLLDVITHHQYDGKDSVKGRVEEIKKLRSFLVQRGHSDKPVWITETGWRTPGFSESAQSANLRGMMEAMQQNASWWHKTFWYDSHGEGWGLLQPDDAPDVGRPRQSYYAYRDVIAAFGPPPPPGVRPAPIQVTHAYRGILGREPDEGGLAAHVGFLEGGGSLRHLCEAMFGSPEFQANRAHLSPEQLGAELYRGLLGREADDGGLLHTADELRAGRRAERAAAMLESDEFRERFLKP